MKSQKHGNNEKWIQWKKYGVERFKREIPIRSEEKEREKDQKRGSDECHGLLTLVQSINSELLQCPFEPKH